MTFKPTVTSTSKMNLNFGKKSNKMQTPKHVTIVSGTISDFRPLSRFRAVKIIGFRSKYGKAKVC